jgi:hypothetical protein
VALEADLLAAKEELTKVLHHVDVKEKELSVAKKQCKLETRTLKAEVKSLQELLATKDDVLNEKVR